MSDALLFGKIAIELGYTTPERINECAQIQNKMRELGIQPKKVGEIMLDKGYLSDAQVKHIFRIQGLRGGHTQLVGYKIVHLIGSGSMGKVYKALQISMDRIVAVKVLSPHLAQNEKFVERFLQEARTVAKLNHPNILQGIDVGESNGLYYFAMEYIDGPDLKKLVEQNGPLEEKQAIDIIIQAARALDHAYRHNVIHRDIKPTNIMITQENITKLCDLGLARLSTQEVNGEGKRMMMGTPSYISPEQARGEPDVDVRSDIYSLGGTFYFLLTGELPFPGESTTEVIAKHLHQRLQPPIEKNQNISPLANSIIIKMMEKKRENRFQTPVELIEQLELARQCPVASAQHPRPSIISSRLKNLSRLNQLRRGGKLSSFRHLRFKRR